MITPAECWPGHPHRWGPVKRVQLGPKPKPHQPWKSVGVRACKCGALANIDITTTYGPIEEAT